MQYQFLELIYPRLVTELFRKDFFHTSLKNKLHVIQAYTVAAVCLKSEEKSL